MPHVDEGLLHAYLDGALEDVAAAGELPDGMTAADVLTHFELCTDCRARLEAERSIREQAGMILRDVSIAHVAIPDTPPVAHRRPRRRIVPLAWAASLFMAVSAGWFAAMQTRDMPEMADIAPTVPSAAGVADAAREAEGVASSEAQPDTPLRSAASRPGVAEVEPPLPAAAPPVVTASRVEGTAETSVDASKAAAPPPAAGIFAGQAAALQREAARAMTDDLAERRRALFGFAAGDDPQRAFETLLERAMPARDSAIDWRAASSTDVGMMTRGVFGIREAAVRNVEVAQDVRALLRMTQSLPSGSAVELIQWQPPNVDDARGLDLNSLVVTAEAGVARAMTQPHRTVHVRTLADGRNEIVLTDTTSNTWIAIRAMLEQEELSRIAQQLVVWPTIVLTPR